MRNALVLALALTAAARAGDPADDADAVVFLGPLAAGEGAPTRAGLGTRAILTNVADRKEWRPVIDALRARGFAHVLAFRGAKLEPAFRELARVGPAFVAVVVAPKTLDVNLHFELLERASRLDEDPFVDFAFGYVTGATPEEALAFLQAARAVPRAVLSFGPSTQPHALTAAAPHKVADGYTERRLAHAADAPDVAATLARLRDIGILSAWGHGYPDGVHEGLKGRQVREGELDLRGALYFSGPCYCGVTGPWYAGGGRVERKEVAPAESFLLALVKARAGAVFAGLDPDRGETSEHELEHLFLTGAELGMVSKSTYDDVALAYRRPTLGLPRYEPGKPDPHRDIHDTMIAGGACRALFGDPTWRPVGKAAEDPFAAETKWTKEGLEVRWTGGADLGGYWMPVDVYRAGGTWTHRIRLRVDLPLDEARRLKGLKVLAVTKDGAPVRHVWATGAVESWGGAARVHLMTVFPPDPKNRVLWGGRKYEARFLLTLAQHDAKARPAAGRAPHDAPAEAAGAEPGVPATALDAARAANRALRDGDAAAETAALQGFGRDGFAAVLALLGAGEGHYRTDRLLAATCYPGAEKEMLALAEGPPLPNFGSWALLRGLAAADTPEVRDYLLDRIARERDPGLYMSAAEALGRLKEGRATVAVAEQVLRFEERWSGVEPHLLHALARMGGEAAVPHLARFLGDERARQGGSVAAALALLEGFDRDAARRAAAELAASPRMAGFDEALRQRIWETAG